jgi:flagellar basal body-associated protein FliL
LPGGAVAPAKKKSKLPLILGIVAVLLVLGAGAVVAVFFLVIKPRLDEMQPAGPVVTRTNPVPDDGNVNSNSSTSPTETTAPTTDTEFTPPADAQRFENSQSNLDGKLAEHYVDFSFYYPKTWTMDPKAGVPGASNFAKVERMLPPEFTQENFAVGWYTSKGTVDADGPTFPQLVEMLGTNLAKGFPGYRKVSEGPTKINNLDGYEFRFVSVSTGTPKGDIQLWGRVVFLPTGVAGDQAGATLIMLATSLAPELSGVEDVGEKGEMPVILESFRFGKKS